MKWLKYPILGTVCRVALITTRDSDIYNITFPVIAIVFVGLCGVWGYLDIKRYIKDKKLKKQAIDNAR